MKYHNSLSLKRYLSHPRFAFSEFMDSSTTFPGRHILEENAMLLYFHALAEGMDFASYFQSSPRENST